MEWWGAGEHAPRLPSSGGRRSLLLLQGEAMETLEPSSARQLRLWLRARSLTWDAVAKLSVCGAASAPRHLLPAAPHPAAATSEFFAALSHRQRMLCCMMRVMAAHRLAQGANVGATCRHRVLRSEAQRIIAAIIARDIRGRTPALAFKQAIRPAEVPPPPCCIS